MKLNTVITDKSFKVNLLQSKIVIFCNTDKIEINLLIAIKENQ